MNNRFGIRLAQFSLAFAVASLSMSGALAQSGKQEMKADSHAAHHKMHESMETMHKDMMAMKSKGDTDQDFITMMIRHHQGAIDMAQIEIDQGKDEKTKAFAKKTIEMQKKDIAELQAMLKNKPDAKASR